MSFLYFIIILILILIYIIVMKVAEYNWVKYTNRRGWEDDL